MHYLQELNRFSEETVPTSVSTICFKNRRSYYFQVRGMKQKRSTSTPYT